MNYELTLQLKNAGFPQKERPFCVSTKMELDEKGEQFRCYMPSLSELIEECGLAFESLSYCSGVMSMRTKETLIWKASGYKQGILVTQTSSTPKEAVSELWLAINKE